MKFTLLIFIIALALYSCNGTPNESKKRTSVVSNMVEKDTTVVYSLQQLYNRLNEGRGSNVYGQVKNDQLLIGDTTIQLKIKVEFQGLKGGNYFYAANFVTNIITSPGQNTEINNGVIGMGTDQQQAFENCINDWMNVFGKPLANMLQTKTSFKIDRMNIYAGTIAVRGDLPPNTWLTGDENMSNIIFKAIGQLVKNHKNDFVPVDIKLLIERGKVVSGECRIGNIVSFELLNKLKALPWPKGSQKFIFSQFYLVEKNKI